MTARKWLHITSTGSGKAMWRCAIAGVCAVFVLAGDAKAYKAYVSNEKSNTISVIDTVERKVVGTIKVGQRPRGIAITKDQKYVLVAVGDDDMPGASMACRIRERFLSDAEEGRGVERCIGMSL